MYVYIYMYIYIIYMYTHYQNYPLIFVQKLAFKHLFQVCYAITQCANFVTHVCIIAHDLMQDIA